MSDSDDKLLYQGVRPIRLEGDSVKVAQKLAEDMRPTALRILKLLATYQRVCKRICIDGGFDLGQLEYRTCVRPGETAVHMQIQGPADLIAELPPMPPDDIDEEMCDDWTDWKKI